MRCAAAPRRGCCDTLLAGGSKTANQPIRREGAANLLNAAKATHASRLVRVWNGDPRGVSLRASVRQTPRRPASPRCEWRRPRRASATYRVVVVKRDYEGWSLYGAPWLQPVATGRKCPVPEDRAIKRKLLPWVASGCGKQRMVRRGSTVRVRQRALRSSC